MLSNLGRNAPHLDRAEREGNQRIRTMNEVNGHVPATPPPGRHATCARCGGLWVDALAEMACAGERAGGQGG